ncbi:MAG: Zn-dependent hydrolase of the beta-lactamase fold-like protein [candidate division WS6 bacterium GW2011_GWC1_36_11]|uniref:Zn-dependent hydrolase of the beta-lactamase fold-like protein n=3 Tax=Candidatus Dojkabacteria TaxID=74243 RepID=A0A0G0GKI9_9BACT|nr:MAG: Zn-dependent hydrolase of the beta-lactamase fold-like protein [candidate division WS6 bacterium GW2011_GWC1_36_11]KKQ03419.1 MAG: Zn-dependent hydrolase of the beta-lactamase fold-like protein [candidate division WS6 bacterium GW2011_WS6_36_26]KKQ12111.1 MAG: Zn-dependent hydrolase of the beta-lactamase fold-like protein [candidate division WS6 bacterium GW2011_GWC2_36_7]KKQ17538.1 MAG: Zn-dependent hydrolase of the beta-lactamase fold-like protein [candidate division WS6 bacterium GW20
MKIKKIGWTSFLISSANVSAITDPLELSKIGTSFPKTSTDIALFTEYPKTIKTSILKDTKLDAKVVPDKREKIIEISTPGEFEVGGLMIRRDLDTDFYIIDENTVRVVYLGGTDSTFNAENIKNIGDVDVLILPVGDGVNFMNFDVMEKVISEIDPAVILPCAFNEEGPSGNTLKTKEEFIKHFGFASVREESYLNVSKKKVDEEGAQSVEVIFLK